MVESLQRSTMYVEYSGLILAEYLPQVLPLLNSNLEKKMRAQIARDIFFLPILKDIKAIRIMLPDEHYYVNYSGKLYIEPINLDEKYIYCLDLTESTSRPQS